MVEVVNREILVLLSRIPFFKEFSQEERIEISNLESNIKSYRKGNQIITQNEFDTSVYVLLKGESVVTRNEAPKSWIARLKPGSVFGEMSFILRAQRSTNIVVLTREALALKIDAKLFESLGPETQRKIYSQFFRLLARRLDGMNDQVSRLKVELEGVMDAHHCILGSITDLSSNAGSIRENLNQLNQSIKFLMR